MVVYASDQFLKKNNLGYIFICIYVFILFQTYIFSSLLIYLIRFDCSYYVYTDLLHFIYFTIRNKYLWVIIQYLLLLKCKIQASLYASLYVALR